MQKIVIASADEVKNIENADFIINNDNQTPTETAEIIQGFISHVQSQKQQWLHLVERRWQALLSGDKTSIYA